MGDGLLIVDEMRGQLTVIVVLPETGGVERSKRNCVAIVVVVNGLLGIVGGWLLRAIYRKGVAVILNGGLRVICGKDVAVVLDCRS